MTTMADREPGYYWVKYGNEWVPAIWWGPPNSGWYLASPSECDYSDDDFDAIGPRLIPPEE